MWKFRERKRRNDENGKLKREGHEKRERKDQRRFKGAYEGVRVEYHRPLFPVTEKKRPKSSVTNS
jgi:hypothetical protein